VWSGGTRLTSIIIPDSVTTIGSSVFGSGVGLTDIYFTGTEAQWNAISFGGGTILSGFTIHFEWVG
jgi:hypothetical protein